jgi:GDP-D-mannose dehydratase
MFVVSTSETHKFFVKFLQTASDHETGWGKYVEIDQKCFHPNAIDLLQGDPSKAKRMFG